jgi:integrase
MDYRLFRKPRIKNGKRVHRWYYYYLDHGRQVQKSCKRCTTKAEAEAYIKNLPARTKDGNGYILVKSIAENMYIPGGPHMSRREELGKPLVKSSMQEARVKIKLIIEAWGERALQSLTVEEVGNYLFAQEKSASWKRNFTKVLREIYTDAAWYGYRETAPQFPKFSKKSKKADSFTTEELNTLFKPENFPSHETYVFFMTSLGAGLRAGEAAAIRPKQIIFDHKALIVDGFCRPNGERMRYNKKGTEEHRRIRVVPISGLIIGLLREHIEKNNIGDDDYCFTGPRNQNRKRAIGFRYLERVFKSAVEKAGIEIGGRRLVPHSLRYTYVTQVRRELPPEIVAKMAGHINEETTEYYNKKVIDMTLQKLIGADIAVNNIFSP